MSTTDTVAALMFVADTLAGLPGLPPLQVSVSGHSVGIQVMEAGVAETTRNGSVDMLAAVLGLTAGPWRVDEEDWYHADGRVGDFTVHVYAPSHAPEQVTA